MNFFNYQFDFITVIIIDLKAVTTQSKFYARVKTALSNENLPRCSFRFTWQPPKPTDSSSSSICPSSPAKYFADLGCNVKLAQTECNLKIEYGLEVPRLGPESDDPIEIDGQSNFYATPHELAEYAGLLALSCDRKASEYLSSWAFKGHTTEVGYALVIRLKGMFTCEMVGALYEKLRLVPVNSCSALKVSVFFTKNFISSLLVYLEL